MYHACTYALHEHAMGTRGPHVCARTMCHVRAALRLTLAAAYSKACLLHVQWSLLRMSGLLLVILRTKPLHPTGPCPPSYRCGLPLI